MAKIKYITLWRVIVLAALISALSSLSLTDWGSYSAIIAAIVAIVGGISIAIPYSVRKWRKRTLFRPKYQLPQTSVAMLHQTYASELPQRVQVTLFLALETHVEFIAILFRGVGTTPTLLSLDDWQYGEGELPEYVSVSNPSYDTESRWWWRYKTPEHRNKDARITIGVKFLATDYFDGDLVFQMTTRDASKEQSLPLKVTKKAKVG